MQPPSTTFLYILDGPVAGGDTLFCNMAVAYRRLSPEFQKRLHGLQAVHSGHEQAEAALARGSIVRRDPVSNIHPVVRTHPVTGEKALFVNPQFVSFFPLLPSFLFFFFSSLLNPHLSSRPVASSISKKKNPTTFSISSTNTLRSAQICRCESNGKRGRLSCGIIVRLRTRQFWIGRMGVGDIWLG